MTSIDGLLRRIDLVLAEQPPTSHCGIEGHDCRMPYVCRIAGLLAAEAAGVATYNLCLPTPFDYSEPPDEIHDDGYVDPDDHGLALAPEDADGYGWSDAMSWAPTQDDPHMPSYTGTFAKDR